MLEKAFALIGIHNIVRYYYHPIEITNLHNADSSKENILVLAIDFDDCIFNLRYLDSNSPNRIIEANEAFINQILAKINSGNWSKIIFTVGSNRQSCWTNTKRCRNTKTDQTSDVSTFSEYLRFCAEIEKRTLVSCSVDKYLLADSCGQKPEGDNFNNAINGNDYQCRSHFQDISKLNITYAQIHKISYENKNANISYCLCDDRNGILLSLADFYKRNEDLLPENVTTTFLKYDADTSEEAETLDVTVKGNGPIDEDYGETLAAMEKYSGCSNDKSRGFNLRHYWFTELLQSNAEALENFKLQRQLQANPSILEKNISQIEFINLDQFQHIKDSLTSLCQELKADIHKQCETKIEMKQVLNSEAAKVLQGAIALTTNINLDPQTALENFKQQFRPSLSTKFCNLLFKPTKLQLCINDLIETMNLNYNTNSSYIHNNIKTLEKKLFYI